MSDHTISEAARATGFSVSALRYYEKQGVVTPERKDNGYRSYGDENVEALRFVARGKQLGLTLEEITELLGLLEEEECEPVQARIHELVSERISQAQGRIAELVRFSAQLQEVSSKLDSHTPQGACDEDCGCHSAPGTRRGERHRQLIPLAGAGSGDIACSLDPDQVPRRIEDWNRALAGSTTRQAITDGVRIVFGYGVDVPALAALAAAEQSCCSSFHFNIGVGPDGVTLDVTGPDDARDVITSVFGAAA